MFLMTKIKIKLMSNNSLATYKSNTVLPIIIFWPQKASASFLFNILIPHFSKIKI